MGTAPEDLRHTSAEAGRAPAFADVFRAALAARGLSLSAMKRMLDDRGAPVALTTLSYWRSASRQPHAEKQRHLLAEAEAVLGLEPGVLSALAARPRVPRRVEPFSAFSDVGEEGEALFAEAMRVLDISPTERLRELSQSFVTDVGVDGYPRRSTVRALLECVEGTVSRVMWTAPMESGGADAAQLTVLAGEDGGQWLDPSNRLKAVAVQLDPQLEVGDTVMLEVRTDYLDGAETEMGMGVTVNRTAQKVINWVRFHPDAVPDWFLEIETTPMGENRRLRGLDAPTSIHQARWDFGPGGIGVEWGYGEAPDVRRPGGS